MSETPVSRGGICIRGAVPAEAGRRAGAELDAALTLATAARLDALLAASVFELSESLDSHELADARARAHDQGIELVAGLPYLHPRRIDADAELLRAGHGDARAGLRRAIEAAAQFDGRDAPFVLGYVEDRMSLHIPWAAQLDDAAALLEQLGPLLRDLDLRLCIKTHEEITTFEIARMIERVGADILSVGFDPVNSLLRMEDPLAAAARVAPYTAHIYLDDATFTAEGTGFRRWLCEAGRGVLDWDAMAAVLAAGAPDARYWVDLHSGQFAIEPGDPFWLGANPDLTTPEREAILAFAAAGDRTWTAADRARLEAAQNDRPARLGPAIALLRRLTQL
jgi:sugar phosphate isomerase/epimerase